MSQQAFIVVPLTQSKDSEGNATSQENTPQMREQVAKSEARLDFST